MRWENGLEKVGKGVGKGGKGWKRGEKKGWGGIEKL